MIRLLDSDVLKKLGSLADWKLENEEITKQYKFKDFLEAMAFVKKVADLAGKADHHPDILIQYNKVTLTLSTHSAGGLTEKDFNLAAQIDS